MKHSSKYKIIFILSMAIFGTIGLFVKSIAVSSGELALYRALLPRMRSESIEERMQAVRAFRMGYAALRGKDVAEV